MFNNYKKIEKLEELEKEISELKKQIPSEYKIKDIAITAIDNEKEELKKLYKVSAEARQEAWDLMKESVDAYAAEYMKQLIKESTKDIEDELIVELARKAMNMEEK